MRGRGSRAFAAALLVAASLGAAPPSASPAAAASFCDAAHEASYREPSGWAEVKEVAVLSRTDRWAVGLRSGGPNRSFRPLALHHDGRRWNLVNVSSGPYRSPRFEAVSFASANVGFAAGWYFTEDPNDPSDAPVDHALAARWDGTSWRYMRTPAPEPTFSILFDVVALAPNDVWVAGQHDIGQFEHPVLLSHWDGRRWTRSDVLLPYSATIFGLAARASDDILAVGWTYRPSGDGGGAFQHAPLILHWNGESWREGPFVPDLLGTLYAATPVSNGWWVVGDRAERGEYDETLPLAMKTNAALTRVQVVPFPGNGRRLQALTAVAQVGSETWVSGYGTNAMLSASDNLAPFLAHRGTGRWVNEPIPGASFALNDLVRMPGTNRLVGGGGHQNDPGVAHLIEAC